MIHKSLNKTKERQRQYDIAYMKMAEAFATLSYAKRKQVGAIIVSKNELSFRVVVHIIYFPLSYME